MHFISEVFASEAANMDLCRWPNPGVLLYDRTFMDCNNECMDHDSCYGFNYNHGNAICSLVVPGEHDPSILDSTGWKYYPYW